MPTTPDLLRLDAALAQLLDLSLAERAAHLAALTHTDPVQAALLGRLLALADGAQTTDLQIGAEEDGLTLVDLDGSPGAVPEIPGYTVDALLGQGGMATVYGGRRQLGDVEQPVAIKLLRTALPGALDRARFLTEQQVMARLRHPAIATLLDVGMVAGRPYMVLERIDGVPLDQALTPGVAPVAVILDALEQICEALQLAHAHFIVHRDLKPANVLVTAAGRIKLIDFGIAKLIDESGARREATLDGSTPLTLRYASPEQINGGAVGVTSDVFQVGLLAHWLCCGSWPGPRTAGADSSEWLAARLRPDTVLLAPSAHLADRARSRALRGDLDAIVLKCLAFDPAERYLDIGALRADLRRHRQHEPVLAHQQSQTYRMLRWLRRHRLAAVAGTLSLGVVAVALVAAVLLAARNAEHAQRMDRVVATVSQMLTAADPYTHAPGSVSVDTVVAAAGDLLLAEQTPADPRFQLRMLELLAGIEERLQHPERQRRLLLRAAALAGIEGSERARQLEAEALASQARAGDLDGALSGVAAFRQRHPGSTPTGLLQAEAIVYSDRGDVVRATAALDALDAQIQADADVLLRYELSSERVMLLTRAGQLDAAFGLLRRSAALLDPALPAHQPAWLRHRATEATMLGQQGQYVQSARALEALLNETRARLGPRHPRVLELAANTGVMWLEAARPRLAWEVLSAIDDAALAEAPGMSRAALQVTRAGAALYSGNAERVLDELIPALQVALETLGPESPRLAYFLERTAWSLFELEQPGLAAEFAAHAWRVSGQTRSAADFLLQLIALRLPVPGRPDPQFGARLTDVCDQVDFALLAALWAPGQPRPEASVVPAECAAIAGMRLATLGLRWTPGIGIDTAYETMDTPLLRRLRTRTPQRDAAMALEAAQRRKLEAALRQLAAPTMPAGGP